MKYHPGTKRKGYGNDIMMTNISTIKRLMEGFAQTVESSEATLNMLELEEDDFTPYEVLYLFQHILGMKVRYKPDEKVAFILFLQYQKIEIAYVLKKFSFKFHMREVDNHAEVNNEIKEKIKHAIELSQNVFTEDAESSIIERNVIFPNYYLRFERAFECLENQIEYNLSNRSDWPQNDHRADCFINSYALHIVSYIEHVSTLLYPFSDSYDAQIDLKSFVSQRMYDKIDCLFANPMSGGIQIKNKITRLNKYVRNPIAHGYLTRAYFGDVLIPDIGYIPMSLSNYKLSSQNYPFFPVNLEYQYNEMKEIKESFDYLMRQLYPNATEIIKSGLSINCDPKSRLEYLSVTQYSEYTEDFIASEQHKVDAMMNMEW
ncbi:MAG: hypothetical protein PHY48_13960 [Candidatus Cloacimonetes bacterium]|nr:hypothetical protein [Candidatus Cloacimonadota bacterium]